jgi:hypothetical protein
MTPLALVATATAECRYCSKELPPHAQTCPSCLHDVDGDKDVYELAPVADIGAGWGTGAIYKLEQAVKCPQCQASVTTLRVLGLSRTQVQFTSTLPRKGRVIVCPKCEQILSAELSGMV